MRVSLTVGKVDAGVAVLLTEDKRLLDLSTNIIRASRRTTTWITLPYELPENKIEFPSILLPPTISSGSIVDIDVSRNTASEAASASAFHSLQRSILATFGTHTPSAPVLRLRNATQTSIVLEWDPLTLATAQLRSLSLYRNGAKAGAIPRPLEVRSTKISGLVVDKEYTFHLVLRTSAGTYTSERVAVRTHRMTDLSGITVTPGPMPAALRGSLEESVRRMGAKIAEEVRIDTTHFVCTEGRGQAWEKALEMNVPVVVPDWVKGCEREGRIVGVRGYYLNADPRLRQVGPGVVEQQQQAAQHQQEQQQRQMDEAARRRQEAEQQQQQHIQRQQQQQQASDQTTTTTASSEEGGENQYVRPSSRAGTPSATDDDNNEASSDDDDDNESDIAAGAAAGNSKPEPKAAVEGEPKARREDMQPSRLEKESGGGGGGEDDDEDEDDEDEDEGSEDARQAKGIADSPASMDGGGGGGGGGKTLADRTKPEDAASFHEVAL